jgi:hypothetical protein
MVNLSSFEVSNYGEVRNNITGETLALWCKDYNLYVTIGNTEFSIGEAKHYVNAFRNKDLEVWSPLF